MFDTLAYEHGIRFGREWSRVECVGWGGWGDGNRVRMVRMTYDFPFDIACGFDLNAEAQILNGHIVKMHQIGPLYMNEVLDAFLGQSMYDGRFGLAFDIF